MTSEIKSIPNSSVAWSALNPLTFCINYIKEARLAPSPHAVTSVISSQSGSLLSNTSPLLLVAGAAALFGTVYLIATRLIPYFFPKTPPTAPGDLGGKTITVIAPPPVDPVNQDNGINAGSHPTVAAQPVPQLPPQPVQVASAVQNIGTGPGPCNDESENREDPVQPPTKKPSSPAMIESPPPPEDQRLSLDGREPRSSGDQSPPESDASGANPLKIAAAVARSSRALSRSNSFVDLRTSLSSSPESKGTENASSSENESDNSTVPLRAVQAKGLITRFRDGVVDTLTSNVSMQRDYSKWTKYRLIQDRLEKFTREENVHPYTNAEGDSFEMIKLGNTWNELHRTLLQPTSFTTADEQYRATVLCLREIRQLFSSADEAVKLKFSRELQFIRALAYVRYTVELYPYCCELLEEALHIPLPALTFDNILEQIELRTEAIKHIDPRLKMNGVAREVARLSGAVNVKFDPLLRTIPYKDGTISANNKSVNILWHATPVTHDDPYALVFKVVSAIPFISYIPYVGDRVTKGASSSSDPTVCADYVAFVEGAANILQVILENGDEGNEKARVQARLKIGVYHENFYPIALRLDGKFFERHDLNHNPKVSEAHTESLQSLKQRLKDRLLMPLGSSDNLTDSVVYRKNMDDQLAANGFCIPQKLRDASQLPQNIDRLLEEVHHLYFPNVENITTLEQHQAFLILSYVHITLFLCWKMDISVLEALCKDDKDRGNVFKTILKLHFLYITGQSNQETLTAVLTHMLARPFVVQKGPIIKSRLKLLQRVIPFITAAFKNNPAPITSVFGPGPIVNPSYTVTKPPGQTIRPSNASSRTPEEYCAFLDKHTPVPMQYNGNIINELSQEFYTAGQARQEAMIMQRVSGAARNMNIKTYEHLFMAPPSAEQELQYYSEGVHTTIFSFLCVNAGLSVADAWKVSCSFQPSLGHKLHQHLNVIFTNPTMGISVKLDEKSLMTPECGIHLTTENNIAQLKFTAIYNITDGRNIIRKIKASMTIADLATGRAQFEYSFA